MKVQYKCPICNAQLRPRDNIILTVKSSNGDTQGIILFHPELGNYTCIVDPELKFKKGEKYNFHCPVCFAELTAWETNEKLVKIILIDRNSKKFDIFFPRIAGDQATFKTDKNVIIEKFGKDSSIYMNYFNKELKDQ